MGVRQQSGRCQWRTINGHQDFAVGFVAQVSENIYWRGMYADTDDFAGEKKERRDAALR